MGPRGGGEGGDGGFEVDIEIRALNDGEMEFKLSGVNPAFANALRRAVIREVPTMAVDEIEVLVNDSAIHDEIIAHRIGMVPLKTPLRGYSLPEECNCEDGKCPKCSVTFSLKKEGPGVVVTGDLKSSDENVVPVDDSIPLVKLEKGQKLELLAIARLGLGRMHAKWQPGVATYKYMPVLRVDPRRCDGCNACVEVCPPKILSPSNGKIKVSDVTKCTMCRMCERACRREAITLRYDDTEFIFRIESNGALKPEQILQKAIKSLEDKCKEFIKLLDKLVE